MIYIDPTEGRENTRLPPSLLKEATELPGLEALSGADILVTPYDEYPLTELKDILPHRKSLQFHCENGVLIQRKSGGDFLSSVDDLTEIEWRMQEWSDNPWLLITEVKEGKRGRTIAGGHHFSRWNWQSVSGIMDAWQDRGGSVKVLPSDEDIYWWIKSRERRSMVWVKEPVKNVSHSKKSKRSRQALRRIQDNWCSTGWAFPLGIGQAMRQSLAKYIVEQWHRPPTLANAIALACSDEVLKVDGWGEISKTNVQEWYGVTNSNSPVRTGAESGCWIYSLPLREKPEKTVLIIGGHIIEGDKVYEVVKEKLGTVGNPIDLSEGIVLG